MKHAIIECDLYLCFVGTYKYIKFYYFSLLVMTCDAVDLDHVTRVNSRLTEDTYYGPTLEARLKSDLNMEHKEMTSSKYGIKKKKIVPFINTNHLWTFATIIV